MKEKIIPKMSAHKIITPDNAGESQKYTIEMHRCVQDYTNEFLGLSMIANFGGIDELHKKMKDHTVRTFEEYRGEKDSEEGVSNFTVLNDEEYQNPTVQNKIKELNNFVIRLNNEGTIISKEEFDKIIKRVNEINKLGQHGFNGLE